MKVKRILPVFLILLLAFSSAASGAAVPEKAKSTKGEENKRTVQQIKSEELEKQYKSTDIVRVIVEMKTEPTVLYAQKQGKRVKELAQATKKQLKAEKLSEHKKVKDRAKQSKVKLVEHESFTTIVNGFSADVMYGDIETVREMPEVSEVHIVHEYTRPQEKPEMLYSKELVQAQDAWRDYGFKGEGMVVGVIDTGLDPSHKDMVLSDTTEQDLTSEEVNKFKNENGLIGRYYTEKVPYGYNYMDQNHVIQDIAPGASMHGMHVGGTVGANGDEKNGGIKGVAPEAQLLALKVFGNDPNMPSTWGDIYVKAIDDAIVLGADVLNMSLGSTAGFVRPEDAEQKAIKRAVDNGILMSISAGNSAHFGNGFANPFTENPDIGVSGSPGVSYDSLQVASIENQFMDLDAATYAFGNETGKAAFLSASSVHPNDVPQKTFELAYAGLGTPEEVAAANVAGKYALIKRGSITFVEKAINAQNGGALGVIIYNNADGYVSMATDAAIKIPQLFMLKNDGDKLQAAIAAGEAVTVSFTGEKTKATNPAAGKMSDFTSWGLTPNLDFKPEITAPGGQIYSTLENNQYGMMSGTSMAAPHVSGGAALVLERVDNEFGVTGFDRVNVAKNLMMNTAQQVTDQGTVNAAFGWELPYSPRRQGAGIMQLHSALQTPVIVTEAKTNEAKVALKEVGDQFEFTLKAQNYNDSAVDYNVAANLQTDFAAYGELGWSPNALEAQKILDASVKVNGADNAVITVPANKSVTFKVQVDVSNAKVVDPSKTGNWDTPVAINEVFPNGYFVEGYVTLTDPTDTNAELTVPYVGFKGDWDKAPVLDGMKYDEKSFYGMSGAVTKSGTNYNYLGYDPVTDKFRSDTIAISPNGDNAQEQIIPVLSFLRNANEVKFAIVDEKGKTLRTLRTERSITKHYYDGGRGANYTLDANRAWDGKINNRLAKDGQYFYEIRSVVDFANAEWQSVKIPVKIDTAKPSVKAELTDGNTAVAIEAADNQGGAGVSYLDILAGEKSILTEPLSADTTKFAIPETVEPGTVLTVVAVDNAGNQNAATVTVAGESSDKTNPEVYLENPAALAIYNTNNINFTGRIVEQSGLKEFTIAGQPVEVTYNEAKKQYDFNTTLNLKDGFQTFEVKAIDNANNTTVFKRSVLVDATAPGVTVKGVPSNRFIKYNERNPKVDVTVKDNFDEIRFSLNGSEIFYQEFKEPYEMRSFEKTFRNIELELVEGENVFEFEAVDLAGNKTVKKVELYKLKKGERAPKRW
ncbi:lactocepin [Bacillus canaveralius]|uniref:Lactocepin n=1 Tax=Bacillus canaveralius TaxID=1403243 RepID=A0A2N5GQC7_9BACI|nr:S8 family serine peptidase [Bacillus canaveralius]PLR85080.1 lactocepin [Bacillus canaveralius]PLS00922.1 lactocepin [Bacillus canaveralius]